ncbi:MAG: hypothetical protein LBC35_05760 [Coriobacteriales bacterium]|jgi:hypothetical protein|nr:hypothetical protein [Coriobacteriales bacterium]
MPPSKEQPGTEGVGSFVAEMQEKLAQKELEAGLPGDDELKRILAKGKRISALNAMTQHIGTNTWSAKQIIALYVSLCSAVIGVGLLYRAVNPDFEHVDPVLMAIIIVLSLTWAFYAMYFNCERIDGRIRRLLPGSLAFCVKSHVSASDFVGECLVASAKLQKKGWVINKRHAKRTKKWGGSMGGMAIALNGSGLELWATRGLLLKTKKPWLKIPLAALTDIEIKIVNYGGPHNPDMYRQRALLITFDGVSSPLVVLPSEKHGDPKTGQLAAFAVRDKLLDATGQIKADPSLYPRKRRFDYGRLIWWIVFLYIAFLIFQYFYLYYTFGSYYASILPWYYYFVPMEVLVTPEEWAATKRYYSKDIWVDFAKDLYEYTYGYDPTQ